MYILKFRGVTLLSNYSNLSYLIDNCIKSFRSDIVVSIYSYPDAVHIATVHSGKCTRTYKKKGV